MTKLRRILDSHSEHVALAADIGVNLIAGSDAGSTGVTHGKSLINEIFHFLDCGVSMKDALCASTSRPRQLWGTASSDIKKGARADMIVLSGDPFVKSENLWKMQTVVRHG